MNQNTSLYFARSRCSFIIHFLSSFSHVDCLIPVFCVNNCPFCHSSLLHSGLIGDAHHFCIFPLQYTKRHSVHLMHPNLIIILFNVIIEQLISTIQTVPWTPYCSSRCNSVSFVSSLSFHTSILNLFYNTLLLFFELDCNYGPYFLAIPVPLISFNPKVFLHNHPGTHNYVYTHVPIIMSSFDMFSSSTREMSLFARVSLSLP